MGLNRQPDTLFEHCLSFTPDAQPPVVPLSDFLNFYRENNESLTKVGRMQALDIASEILAFVNRYSKSASEGLDGILGEMSNDEEKREQLVSDLKRLSDLADPLWGYDRSRIPLSNANETIAGLAYCAVSDEERTVLKQFGESLSPNSRPISFVATSDRDRITLFKVEVGVPLFALDGIREMQRAYYKREQLAFNHIDRAWVSFDDLIPPSDSHFYFSLSLAPEPFAFLLVDDGDAYYHHPKQTEGAALRKRATYLGKGRLSAFAAFESNAELFAEVKDSVDEILNRDNSSILGVLQSHVEDLERIRGNEASSSQFAFQIAQEIEAIREHHGILRIPWVEDDGFRGAFSARQRNTPTGSVGEHREATSKSNGNGIDQVTIKMLQDGIVSQIREAFAGPALQNYRGYVCASFSSAGSERLDPVDGGTSAARVGVPLTLTVWLQPHQPEGHSVGEGRFWGLVDIRDGLEVSEVHFEVALDSDTLEATPRRAALVAQPGHNSAPSVFELKATQMSTPHHQAWVTLTQKTRLIQSVQVSLILES